MSHFFKLSTQKVATQETDTETQLRPGSSCDNDNEATVTCNDSDYLTTTVTRTVHSLLVSVSMQ